MLPYILPSLDRRHLAICKRDVGRYAEQVRERGAGRAPGRLRVLAVAWWGRVGVEEAGGEGEGVAGCCGEAGCTGVVRGGWWGGGGVAAAGGVGVGGAVCWGVVVCRGVVGGGDEGDVGVGEAVGFEGEDEVHADDIRVQGAEVGGGWRCGGWGGGVG